MATHASLPYGLTDLVIEPLDTSFAPITAAGVKLLNGQTLEVSPNEDEVTEDGYGQTVGTFYGATSADVTLTGAGTDLDAYAAMYGGSIVSTGSSPNVVQTYDVGVQGQARPYCRITGRALGNAGGAAKRRVNAVRFKLPAGGFDHKAFNRSSFVGKAIAPTAGTASGKLITLIHEQTPTTLTPA